MFFKKYKQKKKEKAELKRQTVHYFTRCRTQPLNLEGNATKLTYSVHIENWYYDINRDAELFSIKLYNGESNTESDDFKKLVKYTNISKEDFEYEVREIILRELEKLEEQKSIENKEKEIINNLERYGQIILKKGD